MKTDPDVQRRIGYILHAIGYMELGTSYAYHRCDKSWITEFVLGCVSLALWCWLITKLPESTKK